MRVAITGTPGTGKTTATERLDTDLDVVHLNEVVREEDLYEDVDEERDSVVADLESVAEWVGDRDDVVFDSHLSHHLDADRAVVLRCHPEELDRRLRERGESTDKAEENAESEALDVILTEAVEKHGLDNVYEIDTTDRDPDEVADAIEAVLSGDREPSAGTVSFLDSL
jgi:adenylate kinase